MKNYLIIALLSILFGLPSCVTQQKIEYLQDQDKNIKTFNETDFQDYKLKPNDELYLQITSLDEAVTNVFSNSNGNILLNGTIQPYGASLMAYTIDKEGYIQLPVIGKLFAKDKTITDLSISLKDTLSRILNHPMVTVKMVNKYVSVLGEVRNPGHFVFPQDKLTIYDALGLAGDATDYGNRNQIILIRNENGKNLRINLDLTKADILASEYYYLRPNDIVYVKPLKVKFWGLREFPFAIIISAVTSAALVLYYTK